MNIRETLLVEHSKAQTMKIVDYIGGDPQRFEELLTLFLANEYRVTQRSAMALGHLCDAYPELILPYLEDLVENLQTSGIHDAVKRNTVRILDNNVDIPEKLLGLVAEICFGYLADPNEAVAIRVFSMGVLYKICLCEPELSNELIIVLEDHLPHGSAGFKSRGGKILAKLRKLVDS